MEREITVKFETRDFGTVEVSEDDVFTFSQPIFGFEHLKRYTILYSEDLGDSFAWLQSLEEADVCFILVDPSILGVEYNPVFPPQAAELLGNEDGVCWCIATIPGDFEKATANLKSPVLINPKTKCAAQFILDGNYPLRQSLTEQGGEKSC